MADVADTADGTDAGDHSGQVQPAAATVARIGADRLAELEEERRFLLRSLTDLEREREAGDVDRADYEALRDGYTSRAAAVLRSIDAGRGASPKKARRNLRRTIGIGAAVVLVGAGLGVLVARFASPRGSGDTITGGSDSDRIAALLSEGRSALATPDYTTATERYREVLDVEPDNVEARAYLGWVLANAAQQLAGDARVSTLAAGKQGLVDAVETDPTYADSYCFLAIIAAQFDGDIPTAAARQEECLSRDPSSEMQDLITLFVQPMTNSSAATDSTETPESSSTTG